MYIDVYMSISNYREGLVDLCAGGRGSVPEASKTEFLSPDFQTVQL
jgi:hypothetical protein